MHLVYRLERVSTLLVFIMQFMGWYILVAYLGVISSAFCLSAMYALFYGISIEKGYKLTPSNTANFTMASSLGEGLLVMPIGYAMNWFGI